VLQRHPSSEVALDIGIGVVEAHLQRLQCLCREVIGAELLDAAVPEIDPAAV